jgi:L-ascorbate metabolism protein UlaG (beta-lactamase superfamily)
MKPYVISAFKPVAAAVFLIMVSRGALSAQDESRAPAPAATDAPKHTLSLPAGTKSPTAAAAGSITFVGTATVIIRYGDLTILTDPNFLHKGDHVHLGYGLTSQRLTDPAIAFESLPPIDLVLLSHMHADHFDQLVAEKLDRKMPIVSTEGAAKQLEKMGFTNRYALKRWETFAVTKGTTTLRVTAMPGRHGPPVLAPLLLPEVIGSMLDFSAGNQGRPYRMYISGDTMVYDDIRDIPRRYPDVDLALLHLGGTRILGVMTVTMDGKDGVRMLQIIAPKRAIPIHYNDYDVFKSPLSDFEKEVAAAGLQDKVRYLKHGDTYKFEATR